jgi:hypothetical protein
MEQGEEFPLPTHGSLVLPYIFNKYALKYLLCLIFRLILIICFIKKFKIIKN